MIAKGGDPLPRMTDAMSAEQLAAARALLGVTPEQLAAELGVTPHVFEAWEAGTLAMPKRYAQRMAYKLAVVERERALAESGLEECAWLREWDAAAVPQDRQGFARHLAAARQHLDSCPICRARETFLRERFEPLPAPPMPRWLGVMQRIALWLEARPVWLRSMIVGASLLGIMMIVRVLLAMGTVVEDTRTAAMGLAAIVLASVAGAIGGLVYAFAARPLRSMGALGPYLAGMVTVAGYLAAVGVVFSLVGARPLAGGQGTLVVLAIWIVLFGTALGHFVFRRR